MLEKLKFKIYNYLFRWLSSRLNVSSVYMIQFDDGEVGNGFIFSHRNYKIFEPNKYFEPNIDRRIITDKDKVWNCVHGESTYLYAWNEKTTNDQSITKEVNILIDEYEDKLKRKWEAQSGLYINNRRID